MSGRKQHYIPQFLLRGFAEPGRGKIPQVRVITREKTFIAGTDGVAAQREFYSKLGEPDGSLDDLITEAETEYAAIYRDLIALPDGAMAESQNVARLLTHLTIRGGHIRETLSVFGRYAMHRVAELMTDPAYLRAKLGIDRSEPNNEMRQRLDKIYNEKKAELGNARVSRHEFRRWAFLQFKENWDKIFQEMVPQVRLLTALADTSEMAVTGHKKALSDSLEPAMRVEGLAALAWHVREVDVPTFILPDCVAIAHYDGIGAAPLVYLGKDELDSGFFPISPTRVLCAGAYCSSAVFEKLTSDFPLFAAAASWNFVVAPPSLPIGTAIGTQLGDAVVRMLFRTLDDATSQMFAEALAN